MRYLVVRLGAWGDSIIMSPVLREMKKQGHEVYLNTSEEGEKVFENNPNVDKIIPYKKDSIPDSGLDAFWAALAKTYECDAIINMCESIEVALACHPTDPKYNYPKLERNLHCNKNYYEYSFEHAQKGGKFKVEGTPDYTGELFFTKQEEDHLAVSFDSWKKKDKHFVVLWGLSGSGRNKTWPWADFVIKHLIDTFPNLMVVTVGDESCKMLETSFAHPRVIRRSGDWKMRESMLACKYADLVVATDTGLIHAAGCYDTPKVCLLGHTTKENITKHFKNDHSIEADCACAPCQRLIYEAAVQCPIDPLTGACWCMALGLPMEKIRKHIEEVVRANMSNM